MGDSDLGFEYGEHVESLNSLMVLPCWRMLGVAWLSDHPIGHVPATNFEAQLDELCRAHAGRWIMLSQWAGIWREGAGRAFADYVKALYGDWVAISDMNDPNGVLKVMGTRMTGWLDDLRPAASKAIDDLGVDAREQVHQYFPHLAVWHRLDADRWDRSQVQLKTKGPPANKPAGWS